jgi:PAS domain-containing protein
MKALALMPFAVEFDDVYEVMDRACRSLNDEGASDEKLKGKRPALKLERVDEHDGTFDIVERLLELIRESTLCIADLSSNNKNVLWEAGVATGMGKPVILLTQDRASVGFDLRNIRNIEYRRDRLADTLQVPLQTALKAVLNGSPELAVTPVYSAHSQSLAMSTATPIYFLDADYNIKYVNEAAAAIFDTGYGASHWSGRTLRDFVNTFAGRLRNLPAIERNLQVQTEHIRDLERANETHRVCPYNCEPIILDSPEFGLLTLHKTGVAVRDPSSSAITGWVVSFNVVNSSDPQRLAEFHERHKRWIEAKAFCYHKDGATTVPSRATSVEPSDGLLRWIDQKCPSPRFKLARNYAEKQQCFEFASSVMKTPRYGLSSVRWLPEYFFDYNTSEYIRLENSTGDLVGVFRLHLNHDVSVYSNLDQWIRDLAQHGLTFADAGAYLHPMLPADTRRDCLAMLLGYAARLCDNREQAYIYAQVPSDRASRYQKFAFRTCGPEFSVDGWDPKWVPIALKCLIFDEDESVMSGWRKEVGSGRVDAEFINRARLSFRQAMEQSDDEPL